MPTNKAVALIRERHGATVAHQLEALARACDGSLVSAVCELASPGGKYADLWSDIDAGRSSVPEMGRIAVELKRQLGPTTLVPVYEPASPAKGSHYFHARRNEMLPRERYADETGHPAVMWFNQVLVDVGV